LIDLVLQRSRQQAITALGARLRTVWIAAFCLALLGGLFATKVTASMAPAEEIAPDPSTVGTSLAQDTLTKSDKLDVGYLLPSADQDRASPTMAMEVLQIPSRTAASRNSRDLKGPHANRIAVMLPKPRPRIRLSKDNNPSKAAGDLKSCAQPDGLGGLLLSLSGSLRCG
jgi:hypothetical protein